MDWTLSDEEIKHLEWKPGNITHKVILSRVNLLGYSLLAHCQQIHKMNQRTVTLIKRKKHKYSKDWQILIKN